MNYNINEQALGFDRVLPWENQVEVLVKEGGRYFLQICAPEAGSVAFVLGDRKEMCTRAENGIWRLEYKDRVGMQYVELLIDDVPVLTPLLPIAHGYGRPYNYVELETADDDFYRIKDVPHGSVRREYFFSETTGEWESCMVYTPYCYEERTEEEFPVLYLQHGRGENEVSWTSSGKVNFILDNLIAEKKAVPMVVVMSSGMVQTVSEDGKRIVDYLLLEKQMLSDIIPYIETKFRVGKSREQRAMAGLSMGSQQTSIIGFKHPEYFSALGIFSGFVVDRIQGSASDMVRHGVSDNRHLEILEDAAAFEKLFPVYFRAIGDQDPFLQERFIPDDRLLEQKKIHHIRKIYHGGHDWNVWRMCICDFAQLIFK